MFKPPNPPGLKLKMICNLQQNALTDSKGNKYEGALDKLLCKDFYFTSIPSVTKSTYTVESLKVLN